VGCLYRMCLCIAVQRAREVHLDDQVSYTGPLEAAVAPLHLPHLLTVPCVLAGKLCSLSVLEIPQCLSTWHWPEQESAITASRDRCLHLIVRCLHLIVTQQLPTTTDSPATRGYTALSVSSIIAVAETRKIPWIPPQTTRPSLYMASSSPPSSTLSSCRRLLCLQLVSDPRVRSIASTRTLWTLFPDKVSLPPQPPRIARAPVLDPATDNRAEGQSTDPGTGSPWLVHLRHSQREGPQLRWASLEGPSGLPFPATKLVL